MLRQIKNLDAMVNLTSRQSEDIAQKWGTTNNRFVVPNPIRPPARPDPLPPRDQHRLAIVSRLEPQKGLADAIEAFALVRDQVPDARLDLYGDGTQRQLIEGLVRDLGLVDALTMHGHDTLAQETLWTASGFLMPSVFEGYPLASLESMAHGCPVVAYDIKYGPREQIDDGLDGFLVAKGDIAAMAERAVRLLRDPEMVGRMSKAAFAKADQHNHERFLRDWKTVLEGAIALKPGRTHIISGSLDVRRLTVSRRRRFTVFRLMSATFIDRVRRSTKVRRLLGSTLTSTAVDQARRQVCSREWPQRPPGQLRCKPPPQGRSQPHARQRGGRDPDCGLRIRRLAGRGADVGAAVGDEIRAHGAVRTWTRCSTRSTWVPTMSTYGCASTGATAAGRPFSAGGRSQATEARSDPTASSRSVDGSGTDEMASGWSADLGYGRPAAEGRAGDESYRSNAATVFGGACCSARRRMWVRAPGGSRPTAFQVGRSHLRPKLRRVGTACRHTWSAWLTDRSGA